MIDFQIVAVGLEFVTPANVGLRSGFGLSKCSGFGRFLVLGANETGDELALVIDDPKLATVRLDKSGNEKIVIVGMEDVEKQSGFAVFGIEFGRLDKREGDVEASGIDDDVDGFAGVIGKDNMVAVKFFDVGFMDDIAMTDMVKELGIDSGMAFEQFVVGFGESVLLGFADDESDEQIAEGATDE